MKIKFEYRFLIAYILFGGLWILLSDKIVLLFVSDAAQLSKLQTAKGVFYVGITALIFHFYIRKHLIKLRIAEKKARESDELKTSFIQNISHEIRTPLNGIMGFSKLLGSKLNVSQEAKEKYIDIIINSSNQLLTIVNDVLEIAMLDSRSVVLSKEDIKVEEMVREIYEQNKPFVKNNIEFELSTPNTSNELPFYSDKDKVVRILHNLLNNAIKFTHEGEIEFGYQYMGQNIMFFVKDSGIGMEHKEQQDIFKRFVQLNSGNKRNYGGTGLGLAISQEICSYLGGKIILQSEPNKGSVFFLKLPLNPESSEQIATPIPKQKSIQDSLVLIVEDEQVNYMLLNEILKKQKIKTLHASNGLEAIELCKANKDISFVFMDLRMPVLDGIEAAKQIKALRPFLPVVAQTSYVYDNDIDKALEVGCDGYITKPYKKDVIYRLLEKFHKINVSRNSIIH
jgi:signal transduction histidine kinase/ActR/RegA family two-component response regulator